MIVVAALGLAASAGTVVAQQFEIHLGEPTGPSPAARTPENYLAKCLADPTDHISCEIARSADKDGGLESAIKGSFGVSSYVTCAGAKGICLELATLDLDEGERQEQRLPSVDVTITFDYDTATLRQDQAAKVQQIAAALADTANANAAFVIIGHTDSRGTERYNCRLSTARAEAVKVELVRVGAPAAQLETIGAGEHVLLNGSDGEDPANRRVGFARVRSGNEPIVSLLRKHC